MKGLKKIDQPKMATKIFLLETNILLENFVTEEKKSIFGLV